jgi:hypothetical protein
LRLLLGLVVFKIQSLIQNGLLPQLLGLSNLPRKDTLRDFLHRFSPKPLRSFKHYTTRFSKIFSGDLARFIHLS